MVSIYLMPVSVSISITMTTIFITPILAYVILNEALSRNEISTIIVGFVGVLMSTNPDWFNSNNKGSTVSKRDQLDKKEHPYYFLGVIFAFAFAIFSALN